VYRLAREDLTRANVNLVMGQTSFHDAGASQDYEINLGLAYNPAAARLNGKSPSFKGSFSRPCNSGAEGERSEPSGARFDRPGLLQMITDGKAGAFDVILAWREDRLYRGLRPMLDVLELVEKHGIELAREVFDPKMAPVKAWVAKIELDGIVERMAMGRIGRLKDGKILSHPVTLGYDIVDGRMEVNEEEAALVRQIFAWFAYGDADYPGGVPINEIRRRLIAMGARQKTGRATVPWARGVIYSILHTSTYTGEMVFHVNGDAYPIPVPQIIDQETFDKAQERLRKASEYPVRNIRDDGFLLVGKMYDPHGHRMDYQIHRYLYRTLANGERRRYDRKRKFVYCKCSRAYQHGTCDFRRMLDVQKIEQAVWSAVAPFLLDPQNVKRVAAGLIEKWQAERDQHQATMERLERVLARLKEERQWVVTQGRKGILTDTDMAEQLAVLGQEEKDARRELAEAQTAANAGAGLLAMVNELAEFLKGYEGELTKLAATPLKDMTLDQRKMIQKWFDAVVVRVDAIGEGDSLRMETDPFGLLTVTSQSTMNRRR